MHHAVLIASLLVLRVTHTRLGLALFDCRLANSSNLSSVARNPYSFLRNTTATAKIHESQSTPIPNHIFQVSTVCHRDQTLTMPPFWQFNQGESRRRAEDTHTKTQFAGSCWERHRAEAAAFLLNEVRDTSFLSPQVPCIIVMYN